MFLYTKFVLCIWRSVLTVSGTNQHLTLQLWVSWACVCVPQCEYLMLTLHTEPFHYGMLACLNTCGQHASLHCFHEGAVRADEANYRGFSVFRPVIVKIKLERKQKTKERTEANEMDHFYWPNVTVPLWHSTKKQTSFWIQALLVIVYTTHRALMHTDKSTTCWLWQTHTLCAASMLNYKNNKRNMKGLFF